MGSTGFAVVQYSLNPGLLSTFPWLSQTAENFEAYRFRKLCVEYLSSSPSSIAGAICIAPDYNSADSAPVSFQQLEQYQDAYRDLVWSDGLCIINSRAMGMLGPDRYIRLGALAPNLDLKTYDVAVLNVGTTGQSNTNQIGELWVNYDVELFEPTSFNTANATSFGSLYNSSGAGVVTTSLLGTNPVSSGRILITAASNVLSLSNLIVGQEYQVAYYLQATTIGGGPAFGLTSGLTLKTAVVDVISTTSGAVLLETVTATSNLATITLSGLTTVTAPTLALFECILTAQVPF
jgi:hypothetical protein